VIVGSQALHGLCYACFFAAAFIYVERLAEPDVRHSAQTVFGMTILGIGPVVAAPFVQALERQFGDPGGGFTDYSPLWYTTAAIGLVVALMVATLFRDETTPRSA
jgi:NHS family xanthosine MFS transporter